MDAEPPTFLRSDERRSWEKGDDKDAVARRVVDCYGVVFPDSYGTAVGLPPDVTPSRVEAACDAMPELRAGHWLRPDGTTRSGFEYDSRRSVIKLVERVEELTGLPLTIGGWGQKLETTIDDPNAKRERDRQKKNFIDRQHYGNKRTPRILQAAAMCNDVLSKRGVARLLSPKALGGCPSKPVTDATRALIDQGFALFSDGVRVFVLIDDTYLMSRKSTSIVDVLLALPTAICTNPTSVITLLIGVDNVDVAPKQFDMLLNNVVRGRVDYEYVGRPARLTYP